MGPLKLRALLKERSGINTAARRRFSQEFKDELCQELILTSKPINSVAEAYGIGAETLRKLDARTSPLRCPEIFDGDSGCYLGGKQRPVPAHWQQRRQY